MKSYGLILEPLQPSDYIFGSDRSLDAKFGAEPLVPTGDWRPYLFTGINSHQAPLFETNSCVTHGTLNALELLRRRLFNYDTDFSDRFLAKGSGTDPARGNSPQKVAEWFRKNWTVFESEWATKDAKTVADFYADLPQSLKTLAAFRGAEWDFGYEAVNTGKVVLKEALKYSPVGLAVPAWYEKDGFYYRPKGMADNHWVTLLHITESGSYIILDSYEPYIKELHKDFVSSFAMRYYLNQRIGNTSWWTRVMTWLHSWIFLSPEPTTPVPTPEPEPEPVPTPEKPASVRLLELAEKHKNIDPTPKDLVDDALACADSLTEIVRKQYPAFPKSAYTPNTLKDLKASPYFEATLDLKPGYVIISPTGYGNGTIRGHCGIIGRKGTIWSNHSNTGLWQDYFTIDTWRDRYRNKGGLPIYVFKPL